MTPLLKEKNAKMTELDYSGDFGFDADLVDLNVLDVVTKYCFINSFKFQI